MIDKERMAAAKTLIRGGKVPTRTVEGMSHDELRRIREAIDAVLPLDRIVELNLEEELMTQYRNTKLLFQEVRNDPETPANQKAQVANSVVGTIGQLVKMQQDLRREEKLKIMETVLIDAIKTLPEETKREFFRQYEAMAEKAGLA